MLLSGEILVTFTITVPTGGDMTVVRNDLAMAALSGSWTSSLQKDGFTSAAVTVIPAYVDLAPTANPTSSPVVQLKKLPGNLSSNILVVLGVLGSVGVCVAYLFLLCCMKRKREAKKLMAVAADNTDSTPQKLLIKVHSIASKKVSSKVKKNSTKVFIDDSPSGVSPSKDASDELHQSNKKVSPKVKKNSGKVFIEENPMRGGRLALQSASAENLNDWDVPTVVNIHCGKDFIDKNPMRGGGLSMQSTSDEHLNDWNVPTVAKKYVPSATKKSRAKESPAKINSRINPKQGGGLFLENLPDEQHLNDSDDEWKL